MTTVVGKRAIVTANEEKGRKVVMSKVKKVLGAMLAAMLCFALTPVSAFAANGGSGKITIDNAVAGQTYTIYKVAELEGYNAENEAYLYKVTSADWKAFLESKGAVIDGNGHISSWATQPGKDTPEAAQLAKDALAYAAEKGITGQSQEATSTTVVFDDLDLGYYLVDSSLGVLCALTTTATDADIVEKNDVPKMKKEVQENSTEKWDSTNDASIGDIVNFKTTITGVAGTEKYVLTDTMSSGLTLNSALSYFTVKEIIQVEGADPTEETLSAGWKLEEATDQSFKISFEDSLFESIVKTDVRVFVVCYSAVLNEKAVSAKPETNDAILTYNNDGEITSQTKTYTGRVVLTKTDKENGNELTGAEFKFTRIMGDGTDRIEEAVSFVEIGTIEGILTYRPAKDGETGIETIKMDEISQFAIEGMDEGRYTYEEVTAPDGYNKLPDPVEFTIGRSKDVVTGAELAVLDTTNLTVENSKGGLLPSTGGMGTTILYIVGGLLIVGAVIYLVRRRSQSAK